jgi:hypothetical protein
MKLRDVFQAVGNRKYWINFHYDWTITEDDHIVPISPTEITMDSDVDILYQWYTHLNPDVDVKEIECAIENHDYQTFMKWFDKLQGEELEYLPTEAYIYINNAYVGTVCVVYDEGLFAMITDNDHECG